MKKNRFGFGDIVIYGVLLALMLVILFPMIYIVSISFSDTGAVSRGRWCCCRWNSI